MIVLEFKCVNLVVSKIEITHATRRESPADASPDVSDARM